VVKIVDKHGTLNSLMLSQMVSNIPPIRSKSMKPPWTTVQHLMQTLMQSKNSNVVNGPTQPLVRFRLPRQEWLTLDRLGTSRGRFGHLTHRWKLRD